MALQLIENNRAGEAIAALRESLGQNPHDSFAHLYLSEAYRYGGALDQSVTKGELALKLNPNVGQNLLLARFMWVNIRNFYKVFRGVRRMRGTFSMAGWPITT